MYISTYFSIVITINYETVTDFPKKINGISLPSLVSPCLLPKVFQYNNLINYQFLNHGNNMNDQNKANR